MILRELREPLIIILQDAAEAEVYLDDNLGSQFARRTYIRSIFAAIEGTLWLLKTACLAGKSSKGVRVFNPAEFALLKEESYDLKSNGEVKVSSKFLKLPDNIKFVFKYINKRVTVATDIGVGGKHWEEFLLALEVRNRITHPKNASAFTIKDEEIELCRRTSHWFNDISYGAIKALFRLDKDEQKSPAD